MSGRKRNGNLGAVSLRRRNRNRDAMRAYDALPVHLRRWMAEAALPWSPESCLAIWNRARAPEEALARLNRAERAMLDKV
ncbi:hypothetical protein KUV73_05055 [Mameliella alba]|nr:hypothetical protein [Mameliella alba]MBY6169061.1 hypothetical protein [Mameliella alba]MBY6173718.1 hypothetical protein [Mameliella alba]